MSKRKAYGQHFLTNKGVAEKITKSVPYLETKRILEVGPGKGFLTRVLLENGFFVVGIEKDLLLIRYLSELDLKNFHLISGDVLNINLIEVVKKFKLEGIVSNLPYSISTKFVEKIIREDPGFYFGVLMFQKEVAEKLIAPAGSRETGPLSIALQYIYDVKRLFLVKPGSFAPPPAVNSEVIKLTRIRNIDSEWMNKFLDFLFLLFAKRRKKLRAILKDFPDSFPVDKRAEELSIEEILAIFDYFN